jgi:hypothetical protein
VSLDIYIVALFLSFTVPRRSERSRGSRESAPDHPRRSRAACLAWVRAGDEGRSPLSARRVGPTTRTPAYAGRRDHPSGGSSPRQADSIATCTACAKSPEDRSLPGLCVFIAPQQRAQIDPAAGTPLAGIVKGKADTPATPAPHPGSQDDGARVDAGAAAGECKEGREGADRASGFVRADPNG